MAAIGVEMGDITRQTAAYLPLYWRRPCLLTWGPRVRPLHQPACLLTVGPSASTRLSADRGALCINPPVC
ncbi:hypothetical protein ACOMHN_053522 [Nucella lapillus]